MIKLLLLLVAVNPAVGKVNVNCGNVSYHGTGTLVSKDIVITNWHVVRDKGQITVDFPNQTVKATLIKTDRLWDLAALRVKVRIKPIELGKQPRFGDVLTFIGCTSGEKTGRLLGFSSPSFNAAAGIIELSVGAKNGDSGGPILNEKGELAGVIFGSIDGHARGTHVGWVKIFLGEL